MTTDVPGHDGLLRVEDELFNRRRSARVKKGAISGIHMDPGLPVRGPCAVDWFRRNRGHFPIFIARMPGPETIAGPGASWRDGLRFACTGRWRLARDPAEGAAWRSPIAPVRGGNTRLCLSSSCRDSPLAGRGKRMLRDSKSPLPAHRAPRVRGRFGCGFAGTPFSAGASSSRLIAHHGLDLQKFPEAMLTPLTARARLLVATKGRVEIRSRAIEVHIARAHVRCHFACTLKAP